MLEKILKRCGSRGQVLVFTAFMLPVMFMFFGATFEFGWWYLNQSRLQNAADAAVLAGARKIQAETDPKLRLSTYTQIELISNYDPDFEKFAKIPQTAFVDRQFENTEDGIEYLSYVDAKKYVEKNLPEYVQENLPDASVVKLNDPETYLVKDSKTSTEHIYYSVTLSGTVEHLFGITERYFGDMPIKAVALTKLTQVLNEDALLPQVLEYRDGNKEKGTKPKIIYDWERSGQNYSNPRTVRTTNGEDQASRKIEYTAGNTYRTEKIVLDGKSGLNKGSAAMENTGDSYWRSYSTVVKNGQYVMDDMFIDFRPDIKYDSRSFKEDWDITMERLSNMTSDNLTSAASSKDALSLRILSTIEFSEPYEVRDMVDSNGNEIKDSLGNSILPSDPLYIRIESEPIYNDGITSGHSSVRQIIININAASDDPAGGYNTKKDADGNYIYRPLIIFYEGPEKLANTDNPTSTVRDSKPVIINLNADFRGIIVMEHSPVVINGNGHKFYGFVIAKEFKHTKTADDGLMTFDKIVEDLKTNGDPNKIYYIDGAGQLCTIDKSSDVKDADDYNITDYVRPHFKFDGKTNASHSGEAVYALKTATPNTGSIAYWYEYTTRTEFAKGNSSAQFCLPIANNDLLLSYEGWTIIEDINEKKWIVKNPDSLKQSYEVDYYTEYMMNDTNSVYVDQNGEIAYKEDKDYDEKTGVRYRNGAIVPSKHNEKYDDLTYKLRDGDEKIFDSSRDFNLSESHFDNFEGVVQPRGIYYYLEEDGGSSDNFFTTERAAWIT